MANDISGLARSPNKYFIDLSGKAPRGFLLSRTHGLAYVSLAFILIINEIWDASNDFVRK